MARNIIFAPADPERVFDVLDDACAYPRWVVGARRVRAVDPSWPRVGSQFHHALGTEAGELHDSSKVLARVRPHMLVLEVRFRPFGVARVDLRVGEVEGGSLIVLDETPTRGPFARLPRFVADPLISLRNAWALRRLRHEVERVSSSTTSGVNA